MRFLFDGEFERIQLEEKCKIGKRLRLCDGDKSGSTSSL